MPFPKIANNQPTNLVDPQLLPRFDESDVNSYGSIQEYIETPERAYTMELAYRFDHIFRTSGVDDPKPIEEAATQRCGSSSGQCVARRSSK